MTAAEVAVDAARARAGAGCCGSGSCAGRSAVAEPRRHPRLHRDRRLRAARRAVQRQRRPTSTTCSRTRRGTTCSARTSSAATCSRVSSGARACRSRSASSRRGSSLLIAVPIGLLAGYYRGWLDSVVARVTDVMLAFPFVILAIGLAAIMGPSLTTTTVALGDRRRPGAAPRSPAARRSRCARRTSCPPRSRAAPATRRSSSGTSSRTCRARCSSWIDGPHPARDHRRGDAVVPRPRRAAAGRRRGARCCTTAQSYLTQAPRLAVYPGLAIVLAALAFNLLGDALRDVLDPRTTR